MLPIQSELQNRREGRLKDGPNKQRAKCIAHAHRQDGQTGPDRVLYVRMAAVGLLTQKQRGTSIQVFVLSGNIATFNHGAQLGPTRSPRCQSNSFATSRSVVELFCHCINLDD